MDKKKLSISKNEWILLLVVGVSILFFVAYTYLYQPLQLALEQVREEESIMQVEYVAKTDKVNSLPMLEKKLEELKISNEAALGIFYKSILQEELIRKIDAIAQQTELTISSTSFEKNQGPFTPDLLGLDFSFLLAGDGQAAAIPENMQAVSDLLTTDMTTYWQTNMKVSLLSVTYDGTLAQLLNFIKAIQENPENMMITNFSIGTQAIAGQKNADTDRCAGGFSIVVPQLDLNI